MKKAKPLSQLKKEILKCRYCKDKFGFEPNPLVWGNECAKIAQISQAPSYTAHLTGKLWADKGGEGLKYEWYQISDEIFYNPDIFYITAIAHCFPGRNKKGSDIKPPIDCARKWLFQELSFIKNKIYLIIGKEAAKFLFPNKDYNQLIFKDQILNKKPAFVLPHPSPANRKWFKDNSRIFSKRLSKVRKVIHRAVYN